MFRLIEILGLLAGLSVSCSTSPGYYDMIASEPHFVGFITDVQPNRGKDVLGIIVVESHADKLVRRHIVKVTDDTLVFKFSEKKLYPASFQNFEVRTWVKVWFAGPVMEKYPANTIASQVIIIDHP